MHTYRLTRRGRAIALLAAVVVALGWAIVFPTSPAAAATTLKTYSAPAGPEMSTDYTVRVRILGGSWVDLDEYRTRIGGPSRASWATFVSFDTDGPVELSVSHNLGTVSTMKVRPSAEGITAAVSGTTGTFTIAGPTKVVVDVNDNVDQDLMIFANPLETNVPSASDPNVIYYGPGFHDTGDITVPSGKTLYIAGGAVIRGGIIANDVSNVTIRGRGILYRPAGIGFQTHRSNGVTIDGIIVNGYGNANNGGYGVDIGASNNITVNNVVLFAYRKWTDGVDSMASTNVTVNDSFIRTGDDSIAIYGTRWDHVGSSNNFNVTNSVLMPGNAHPINVGTHGNPDVPDTINAITVSNVDILTHNPLSQVRSISLTASDSNLVTNVLFTDIRWEDVLVGKFLDIITYKNPGYGLSVGRGIDGVTVKNFSYTGPNNYTNDIYGNSATQMTKNIAFENLTINGQVATTAGAANVAIGNYTSNITFAAGSAPAIQSGSIYKLVNAHSNKVLGISGMSTANNAQAVQWADTGTADHEWMLTRLANGHYKLTNIHSGKVLGVSAMSTLDGAKAVQYSDNGTLDHEWQLVTSANGSYKFVNVYTSKVLGISGMSKADGADALQWNDTGTADHNWNLVFVR
ncbi:RICIN domain-containing protein [Agromyces albus]|uniref:Ricin B lectin domain-containing protein n=1 Tax=Agromyces albus TaxID=205332 RepID=A0A4Q2KZ09_9MICO|nr:RICIN domain-containing protein [Agromyces albus]RXZ70269.1 hypothetical protein ESP51_10265 [Agromyces albus]